VLLVSLYGEVYKRLYDLYCTHPTITGEMIGVYQPSHEENQQIENHLHNYKASSEIWLLSFSDVLVSGDYCWIYIWLCEYSLAGIKPWFLQRAKNRNFLNLLPCLRASTIGACWHSPPNFNCKTGSKGDTGNLVRHVRPYDDFHYPPAVKLFDYLSLFCSSFLLVSILFYQ
jgi:xyloglucan fucosyltransferase